jgi:hypothetical protein
VKALLRRWLLKVCCFLGLHDGKADYDVSRGLVEFVGLRCRHCDKDLGRHGPPVSERPDWRKERYNEADFKRVSAGGALR